LKLKKNINPSEICLTLREIMKAIINNFDVDYVIKIPVSDKIKLNEASIITTREFLLNEIVDRSKFDQQNNIKKVVVFGEEISFETTDYDDASLYFNKSKTVKEEKVSKIIKNDPNMKKDLSKVRNSKSINVKENTNYDTKNENRIEISSSYVDKSTNATSAHEIKKIATSNFRTNSTYKLRTDSISNLEGIILHPKGIHNPSVYCFMNTCMQCLFSIPELNYFFSSQNYKKEIKNKINISGCEALYEFIDSYNSAGRRIKSPQSLFAVCHSFLQPQRQHDCQEFLRKFLSKLQEEMNFNKKYTFPDKITYEKAWNIYREVNPSFIDGIFTGLIRSSVYCNKCQFRSDTYDPFMDLSVPIQRKNMERLENCLDNYFAKEFIDCEYKCSSCKKKTSVKIFSVISN